MTDATYWKTLLRRYMYHIELEEGSCCIPEPGDGFTDKEIEWFRQMRVEVYDEISRRGVIR